MAFVLHKALSPRLSSLNCTPGIIYWTRFHHVELLCKILVWLRRGFATVCISDVQTVVFYADAQYQVYFCSVSMFQLQNAVAIFVQFA